MRQIPKKVKTGTSTNDLLGIRFRRKGSNEVKFMLKESAVIGYLKCQLCKIKFKINEVEDHLSKQKHTKKMEEVSMVLYTNKDSVREPLPVTTCVISPPVPLGSSTNAIVSMKNVQTLKMHENKIRTNVTKEQESKTTASKIPKLLPIKTSEKFSQRLEINSRENLNFLSQDGTNNTKRLLYSICKKDLKQIQCYDIENNWKVLLIHAGEKLAWCIYKNGMMNAFITKTNNLIALPSGSDYTNLLSLYRSVIKQPHVEVLQQYCNITYQIWPRGSIEHGIEPKSDRNTSGCLTNGQKCLMSTIKPQEQTSIGQIFEQKCMNLSIDLANEMQYSTYKSSHLRNVYDTFTSLRTKTFPNTSDKTFEQKCMNLSIDFANEMHYSTYKSSHLQNVYDTFRSFGIETFENTSDKDEQNSSLQQTIPTDESKDARLCEEKDSTFTTTDKGKISKLEEQPRTTDVDSKDGIDHSFKDSEQGLSNNLNNNDTNSANPSIVEPMTFERFKEEYVKLGIDQLVHIKYRISSHNPEWFSMVQPRGFRFFCKLCGSNSGHKDIEAHVRGARHAKKAERIKGMHHPIFYNTLGETAPIVPVYQSPLVEEKPTRIEPNTEVPRKISGSFTLAQFKREYVKFDIKDFLNIRYRLQSSDWDDLIITDQTRYYCRLCGNVPLGSIENVALHISGRRHAAKVDLITEMQHPNYIICLTLEELEDIQSQPSNESESSTHELDESSTDSSGNSEATDIITESSNGSNNGGMPLENFKRNYVNLDISELLKIKCRTASKHWFLMISKKYGERYYCNLCRKQKLVGDRKNLEQHLKGARHMKMLREVVEMYPLPSDSNEDLPAINKFNNFGIIRFSRSSNQETTPRVNVVEKETMPKVVLDVKQPHPPDAYELDEFKCQYVAFDIKELLQIEYKLKSGKREFMIVEENGNFICQLCKSGPLGGNLVTHFIGARHACRIHDLVNMYHPRCLQRAKKSQVEEHEQSLYSSITDTSSSELTKTVTNSTVNSETTATKTDFDSVRNRIQLEDYVIMDFSQLIKIKCCTKRRSNCFPMITKASENRYICNICKKRKRVEHFYTQQHIRKLRKVTMSLGDAEQTGDSNTYTLDDFKHRYVAMSNNELLKIEFKLKYGKKEYMLVKENGKLYCQLCHSMALGSDLLPHLLGNRHVDKLQDLVGMFHPQIIIDNSKNEKYAYKKTPIADHHGLQFCIQDSNEKPSNTSTNSSEVVDELIQTTQNWNRRREEMLYERSRVMNLEIERIKSISTSGSPYSYDTTQKQIAKDFIANHGYLSIDELFEVQFKNKSNEWHYMLTKRPLNFICNLCKRESLKKEDEVYEHIRGEYHTKKMTMTEKLYHPKYYPIPHETSDRLGVRHNTHIPVFSQNAATHPHNRMSFLQMPLPLFPQTHNIGSDWWDITKDMNFEDFKLHYINSNVENLLKIEYRDNEGKWTLMLEVLDGEVYCVLCGHVNLLDRNQMFVRAHVRGSLHMGNMQSVTGIRHPDFCALRGMKNIVVPTPSRDHFKNDTSTASRQQSSNSGVFRSAEEYKRSIANINSNAFIELMETEFLDPNSGVWKQLIAKTTTRYVCNLCWGINLLNKSSVMGHIQGSFHQSNLANVREIHHPLKFPTKEKEKTTQKDGLHQPTLENKQTVDDQQYPDYDWNALHPQKFSSKDGKLVTNDFKDGKLQKLITEIDNMNDDHHVCDLTCRIVFMELIFPRLARKIAENCNVNSKTTITDELVNSIFKDTEAFCKNGCILNWMNKGFENMKRKVIEKSDTTDILSKYYTDLGTPFDSIAANANTNNIQVYNCSTDYRALMNSRPSPNRLVNATNHAYNLERENIEASSNSRSPDTMTFENFMAILARLSDLEDFLGLFGPASISLLANAIRIRREQLSTQSEKQLIAENLEFLKLVQIELGTALQSCRLAPEKEISAAKVVKDITMFLRVANRQQFASAENHNDNNQDQQDNM